MSIRKLSELYKHSVCRFLPLNCAVPIIRDGLERVLQTLQTIAYQTPNSQRRGILDAIVAKVQEHVILSYEARAAALWILFTYLVRDCFQFAPRLGITSPTKGYGKSTLLNLVSAMARRALRADNISASAVFRVIDKYKPALLIDEADSYLPDNDELRGVLDSGYQKGGCIIRAVGEDFEPRAFATYGAAAIAAIEAVRKALKADLK
jgi:hypothetical protein